MAGVKGQATARPSDLPDPASDMFAPPTEDEKAMFAPPSEEELGAFGPPDAPVGNEFSQTAAGQMVQTAAEWLPAVGGFIGGIAGGVSGAVGGGAAGGAATLPAGGVGAIPGAIGGAAVGSIAGASLGGAAGASYRDLIETQILGRPLKTNVELAQDIGGAAVLEGASQAAGGVIMKGAGAAARGASKYIAQPVKEYMGNVVKNAIAKVEEPLMKMVAERAVKMNSEEAGNAAKELLKANISKKYGSFVNAYGQIEDVSKVLPVADESRRTFTNKVKGWAMDELSGDNYRIVKKFTDQIDAAGNGKQIDDVIRQISDMQNTAYTNKAYNQAKILSNLKSKAVEFMESQTENLAKKISNGKATPEEMAFLQKYMAQRGIPEGEAIKYAQSISSDYLKGKSAVGKEYAAFREFLSDVGEQVKVNADKYGPRQFMEALNDVPSEKLIERMFDPKNAAALRRMQEATPEVFDLVKGAKMTQVMQQASPDGVLDLKAFRKNLYKMPESTREFLFSKEEMKILNQVADNPKLVKLKQLQKAGDGALSKWAQNVLTAAELGVEGVSKSPAAMAGIRQIVGKPIAQTGSAEAKAAMSRLGRGEADR